MNGIQKSYPLHAKRGLAILVVIPMLLFVAALGLLTLYMVQSKLQSTTISVQSLQAKYLARSAIQLALLEIQPVTPLKTNCRKNEMRIEVVSGERLNQGCWIAFGGHTPGIVFQLTGSGTVWNIDPALTHHLPQGSWLYLCRDIDGDGTIGSLGTRALETGIIMAERNDPANDNAAVAPVIYLRGKAKVGSAESVFETAVCLK